MTTTRTIVEKVSCAQCRHFIGIVASDGSVPVFDECPDRNRQCAMFERLAKYQTPQAAAGIGNGKDPTAAVFQSVK
jgi:hypothetical protein